MGGENHLMNQFGNLFYSYVPSGREYSNIADVPDIRSHILGRVNVLYSSNLGFRNSTRKGFFNLIMAIQAITRFLESISWAYKNRTVGREPLWTPETACK